MSETIVFRHDPGDPYPWNAYTKAEEHARSLGLSVGIMQRGAPTALFLGECEVSKWRNLSPAEQSSVDGTITSPTGSFLGSDVTLTLLRRTEA